MDSLSLADDLISSLSMNDSTGKISPFTVSHLKYMYAWHVIMDFPFTLEPHD